jgi:uncharacterized membrane protein
MSELENVVVVRFTEPSKAYEALSVLKKLDADDRIDLKAAALVERAADGKLSIVETAGNAALEGTASGSLIGMLVGVLGGPFGVLFGWATGAMAGGVFDLGRTEKSYEGLGVLAKAIPTESTAVVADVKEPVVEVIDAEMFKLDGDVTRMPVSDVLDEIELAEEAVDAAAAEARRVTREKHKAEIAADVETRKAKLKEKLHVS